VEVVDGQRRSPRRNGKEHMALISSLLSLPVGIRLVVFTKAGVEFIN